MSKSIKSRYYLLCALVVALFGAGVAVVFWPKTIPLRMNPRLFTGFYWGDDGFLGRHYYKVRLNEGSYGYYDVSFNGVGYNPYQGYYADGTLREEGEIKVDWGGLSEEPQPSHSDVKWGKYYRPNGTLGAEIRDGTGEQIYWFPDGRLRWRLVLKDFKRVTHEHWTEDGQLISKAEYDADGYHEIHNTRPRD